MSGTLQSKELKFIAIEVHFALLENYGYKNAPKQICEILEKIILKFHGLMPRM